MTERMIARVKWFGKSGYGFLITDTEDLFVHHNELLVGEEQYRYLVAGEYVEYELLKLGDESKHKYMASKVTGVNRGPLMCETRYAQMARNPKVPVEQAEVEHTVV